MAVRAVEHRVSELNQPQRPILMLKMRCQDNELMRGEDKAIAMKIVKRAPPGLDSITEVVPRHQRGGARASELSL